MEFIDRLLNSIRNEFHLALTDPANINDDGINWNFVEADIYLALANQYDVTTDLFRHAVDKIFNEEVE